MYKRKTMKSINKINIIYVVAFALICVVITLAFFRCYKSSLFSCKTVDNRGKDHIIRDLDSSNVVKQSFSISNSKLYGIFFDFKGNTEGIVNVWLTNVNGEALANWEVNPDALEDEGECALYLDDLLEVSEETTFFIVISSEQMGDELLLNTSGFDAYPDGEMLVDDVVIDDDLSFAVMTDTAVSTQMFTIIVIISFAAFSLVYWMCVLKLAKMQNIFIIAFGLMGIVYLMVFPPFSTWDEGSHIAMIYAYVNPADSERIIDDNGYVVARQTDCDFNLYENYQPNIKTYERVQELLSDSVDETAVSTQISPLSQPLTSYIPQVAGGLIAKLFHANGMAMMYIIKSVTLALVCICGYFAIKLAPVGKSIIFACAMLPMWLEAASSFNYDATTNALTLLFIAYVLHLKFKKEKISIIDFIPIFIIMAIVAPIKQVYLLMALITFIIPISKYSKRIWYLICNVGTLLISALLGIFGRITWIAEINNFSGNTSGIYAPAVEYWTMGQILGNPIEAMGVFFGTIGKNILFYVRSMVGDRLGWYDIPVRTVVIIGFIIVLILAALSEKEKVGKNSIKVKDKVLMIVVFVLVSMAILLAMWLYFTPSNSSIIEGVSGRYFLPILPLLLLCLIIKKGNYIKKINRFIPIMLVILNIFVVREAFSYIITR